MKLPISLAAIGLACAWSTATLADAPRVVATIKPIHSLVASVMGELGAPDLIVRGGASPHTYSLRPSDAAALEEADLVFWTGHGMELFLEDALDSLAGDATVVELADSSGIELLPVREGGVFDAHVHDDAHDHDDHDHANDEDHDHEAGHDADGHEHDEHEHVHDHAGEMDMHYWLDPLNAMHMIEQIALSLGDVDPENSATYQANAAAAVAELQALVDELRADLEPIADTPFIVFHDAVQYFERRFGLTVAGSITVIPDTMPGAAPVAELRARIADTGAACVFAEPQFEPTIVATIIEGTSAKAGTLDPEGGSLDAGPSLYPTIIRNLAAALRDCLL